MKKTQALRIHAGRRALSHLREHGLRPADVRVLPAAASGPTGLVLNPLDRFVFGHWLPRSSQPVHLLGASIGAWRMASACLPDADAAFAQMAQDYAHQRYEHAPGRMPAPGHVSAVLGALFDDRFTSRADAVLGHARFRLHLFTARGRGALLRRQCRWRNPLGYLGAAAFNTLISRRALGAWLERVVFHDPRAPLLPLRLHDFRSRQVALDAGNLGPALLASCSIPFWLDAVHDIPGAPRGAYWDGGLTDYQFHLDYASMGDAGLVLYPHTEARMVPGWLDGFMRHRHRGRGRLDNVVVISPDPDWVRTALPRGRLPDRTDFTAFAGDIEGRARTWLREIAESQRLADEFARLVEQPSIEALPLD
ncbi:patatin-like phospholipase family protein [Azohydromonas aeria]|uniref:patatin-like phospholipase family protein n=1 Tax=Azohydromonas aeria TaxID=2590212 RepID=UPI0012FB32C6|nr:patatin-like phospholipase family protein [Azohydromonas aeria]